VTAPQILALATCEHVGGDGVEGRGAAAALPASAGRADRKFPMTTPYRAA